MASIKCDRKSTLSLAALLTMVTSLPVIAYNSPDKPSSRNNQNQLIAVYHPPHGRLHVRRPYYTYFGAVRGGSCLGDTGKSDVIALAPSDDPKLQDYNLEYRTDAADPFIMLTNLPKKTVSRFYLYKLSDSSENSQNDQELIYYGDFKNPDQPGIVALNLAEVTRVKQSDVHYKLALEGTYSWKVEVLCANSQNPIAELDGSIQRIDPDSHQVDGQSETITQQLSKTTEEKEKYKVYLDNGLWYSALKSLSDLQQKNPKDQKIKENWRTLLKTIDLETLADRPIVTPKLIYNSISIIH